MALQYYSAFDREPEPKKKTWELRFDTEPIVGWRVWKIRKQDHVLSEMLPEIIGAIESGDVSPLRDAMRYHLCPLATGQTPWPASKRFEAECHSSAGYYTPPHLLYTAPSSYGNLPARTLATHEAPHVDCMCGAWAVREGELDTAMKQYNGIKNDAFAWGEVHLWGHVVEAEKGYRARFAYPKNLTLVNGTDEMEEDLALLYNVPVSRGGWKKSWDRPPTDSADVMWAKTSSLYTQMYNQMMFGIPNAPSIPSSSLSSFSIEWDDEEEKKPKRWYLPWTRD